MAGGGDVVFGVLLAGIGAMFLALAMSVQRYALTTPPPVPCLCGSEQSQFVVWFSGLLIYWVANGLFAVALPFAPLALLGGVFTTLLVWNLVFGKFLLGETITPTKIAGACLIMVGVGIIGAATPSGEIPTEYNRAQGEAFIKDAGGLAYLIVLVLIVLACVVLIMWFEKKYPLPSDVDEDLTLSPKVSEIKETGLAGLTELLLKRNGLKKIEDKPPASLAEASAEVCKNTGMAAMSKKIAIVQHLEKNDNTPPWLNDLMGVVYPGSLGLDEGIGHLAMKSFTALLAGGEFDQGITWGMIVMWAVSSLATLWWLQTVFRRYDVTQALPIEYGAVMVTDTLSSFLYYKEGTYMSNTQTILVIIGMCVVVIGIAVGRSDPTHDNAFLKYDRIMILLHCKKPPLDEMHEPKSDEEDRVAVA